MLITFVVRVLMPGNELLKNGKNEKAEKQDRHDHHDNNENDHKPRGPKNHEIPTLSKVADGPILHLPEPIACFRSRLVQMKARRGGRAVVTSVRGVRDVSVAAYSLILNEYRAPHGFWQKRGLGRLVDASDGS